MTSYLLSLLLLLASTGIAIAQMQTLSPGLRKLNGVETESKISYARLFLDGIRGSRQ